MWTDKKTLMVEIFVNFFHAQSGVVKDADNHIVAPPVLSAPNVAAIVVAGFHPFGTL
jgi:hypothetical protein